MNLVNTLFHATLLISSLLVTNSKSDDTCTDTNNVSDCVGDELPERTFIALKPDAVQRGLVGQVLSRFEAKGFKLVAMKLVRPGAELVRSHYAEHEARPFFPALVSYMRSGPVLATVWEGAGVVRAARALLGATNPLAAAPGTIRGDLAMDTGRNLCHASDGLEAANREIKLWFHEGEILEWASDLHNWIHE